MADPVERGGWIVMRSEHIFKSAPGVIRCTKDNMVFYCSESDYENFAEHEFTAITEMVESLHQNILSRGFTLLRLIARKIERSQEISLEMEFEQ